MDECDFKHATGCELQVKNLRDKLMSLDPPRGPNQWCERCESVRHRIRTSVTRKGLGERLLWKAIVAARKFQAMSYVCGQ